ncbi:MAG TPA: ABC transporter substrate-binding protein [Myxococcales bacterium]|nr:ABC transporter substrate-binding protein [Myxococcales bacterium]
MRALLAVLLFASLSARAENGVTPQEVSLGQSAAFSGTSAGLGIEMWRGAQAAFLEANASNGGVHGRKVKLVLSDDAYDAEKAAFSTYQLIAKQKVFALFGGVGTPTIIKALPVVQKYFNSEGLFYFANFTGAQPQREAPFDKAVFNIRASYREEAKAMIDAFLKAGRTRIGVFLQDDAYGTSGRDAVKRALATKKLTVVADTTYPRGQAYAASTEPQVAILRDANVDAIIAVGSYQACAALVRDARRNGLDVPIHNLSFVGADQMLRLLREEEKKTGLNLTRRLIVTQVVPSFEDRDSPFIARYRAAMERFDPGSPPIGDNSYTPVGKYSFGSVEGYLSARAFLAVLEKTGPDLTRRNFYQAAEKMGRFDLGLGEPLEFSPERHQALNAVWFTVVTPEGWRSVKDPIPLLQRGADK